MTLRALHVPTVLKAMLLTMMLAAVCHAQPRQIPHFEPDPAWPKLPAKWVFGQVSSVSIDERGHAWILQRPTTIRSDQKARNMAEIGRAHV